VLISLSCLLSNGCQASCANGTYPPHTPSYPSSLPSNPPSSHSGYSKSTIGIIVGSTVGGVLLIIICISACILRMQGNRQTHDIQMISQRNISQALTLAQNPDGRVFLRQLGFNSAATTADQRGLPTTSGRYGNDGDSGRVVSLGMQL
jgi:hypothetical protein